MISYTCLLLLTVRLVESSSLRLGGNAKRVASYASASWTQCAVEGQSVTRPGLARFGWDQTWIQATLPAGASCSIASFGGDPVPNILKVCECSANAVANPSALVAGGETSSLPTADARDELGVEWRRCATEGAGCGCVSGGIRFGTKDRWVVTEFGRTGGNAGTVACEGESFQGADPAVGKTKECWCRDDPLTGALAAVGGAASGTPPASQRVAVRVAIVLLSRRPPDLHTWLRYHLDHMSVDHVFAQIEDSPEFDSIWASLSSGQRSRLTVWRPQDGSQVLAADGRPLDDYTTLQNRQMAAMARAKQAALGLGIDWLIHIDDDELLYAPSHRTLGSILGALPPDFVQAYIPNVEALYSSAGVKNCFAEASVVNTNIYTYVSYVNGKAAIRVGDAELHPAGPHQWRTVTGAEPRSLHLDAEAFGSPLLVVHFESCPFSRWEDKFWELGNTSPEKLAAVPFPFYRESITRMQQCQKLLHKAASIVDLLQAQAVLPEACSEQALRKLWSKWKTRGNPAYKPQDLMPLQIPWATILET